MPRVFFRVALGLSLLNLLLFKGKKMDDFDEDSNSSDKKLSPKEYAKQRRKEAYQFAKERQKKYLLEQKNKPMTEKEKEFKDKQKEKARLYRREIYLKQKEKLKSQKESKKKEEKASQKIDHSPVPLDVEKLKLVTFDDESESFQPLKAPPKLRLVTFENS